MSDATRETPADRMARNGARAPRVGGAGAAFPQLADEDRGDGRAGDERVAEAPTELEAPRRRESSTTSAKRAARRRTATKAEVDALTKEAQRLARMAGHSRLRGEGNVFAAGEVDNLRTAVEEARAFEEATAEQREAAAASLAKLGGVSIVDRAIPLLCIPPIGEVSALQVYARALAWPPRARAYATKLNVDLAAELLSVKVRRSEGYEAGSYVCAHGVSRQSIYRMLEAIERAGVPLPESVRGGR